MYVPDPGLEYVISAKIIYRLSYARTGRYGLTSIVCIELGKELVSDSELEVLFECLTFQF